METLVKVTFHKKNSAANQVSLLILPSHLASKQLISAKRWIQTLLFAKVSLPEQGLVLQDLTSYASDSVQPPARHERTLVVIPLLQLLLQGNQPLHKPHPEGTLLLTVFTATW